MCMEWMLFCIFYSGDKIVKAFRKVKAEWAKWVQSSRARACKSCNSFLMPYFLLLKTDFANLFSELVFYRHVETKYAAV